MKINAMSFFKQKKYLFSTLLVLCSFIFAVKPAFSQIDYSYGLNKKGFRLSIGLGGNTLQTTWTKTPVGFSYIGTLGYDINNYFTILAEGQYGDMSGVDGTSTYRYSKTVASYYSYSANLRFSLGLLSDFESQNGFTDAIKRSYIGIGFGQINSKVSLTNAGNGAPEGTVVPGYNATVNLYKSSGYLAVNMVPLNLGTNIAMPGVWGADAVELNPNFQYSLFMAPLADGYQPTKASQSGGYGVFSISLRFKF